MSYKIGNQWIVPKEQIEDFTKNGINYDKIISECMKFHDIDNQPLQFQEVKPFLKRDVKDLFRKK